MSLNQTQSSIRSGVAGEAPPARSSFAAIIEPLRARLGDRPDTEHQHILWRSGFLLLAALGFVLQSTSIGIGMAQVTTLVTLAALLGCLGFLALVVRNPAVAPARRVAATVVDYLYLGFLVYWLGPNGAWFVPIFTLVAVDASLRYGRNYGYAAAVLGVLVFVAICVIDTGYWRQAGMLVATHLVTMIIVPAYVAGHSHQLRKISESYQQRARKMARVAMEDPLTLLANRAYFRRSLEKSITRARHPQSPEGFAILYCDLDGFKGINDTHGHHVGDVLLKTVARVLNACVRGSDLVARLGGDEFAIILKGINDKEIATRIGQSIVERVHAINRLEGRTIKISCSVGITLVEGPLGENDQLESILARADDAMYQAKRAGKNQIFLLWAKPADTTLADA